MTNAAPSLSLFDAPPAPAGPPLPEVNDHPARVADIVALWNIAIRQNQRDDAQEIFNKHPGAKTDADTSVLVQAKLRTLLGFPLPAAPPANIPLTPAQESAGESTQETVQLTGTAVEEQETANSGETQDAAEEAQEGEFGGAQEPADLEEDPSEPGDEGGEDEVGADGSSGEKTDPNEDAPVEPDSAVQEPQVDLPAFAVPTPEPALPAVSAGDPSWPESALSDGILSRLARTLAPGDTLQLVLSRSRENTLIVTVQPHKYGGEPDATARGLQVTGTPAELDAELPEALPIFEQSRKTARQLAQEQLEATVRAAEQTRVAAAKAKTDAAARTAQAASKTADAQMATVTVKVAGAPEALIHLENEKAAKVALVQGKAHKVAPGKYTLHAVMEGQQPYQESVTLKPRETRTVEVALKKITQPSLL